MGWVGVRFKVSYIYKSCIGKSSCSMLGRPSIELVSYIVLQSGFLTGPPNFQYQNEKTTGSQSEILFHEIFDVQKIVIG